ncbi:hypothetical protein VAR608DRAFT_3623 [Variovorax sp. HW608]|uniref:hypothetical protein n=1 Tax=Variovorax sp. HW608 TaxID=1034889 RepID=UPI00081FF850|nr:hypothetical protein [Variovorax sp. HW608]SCK38880.1 hypothetical protein VAR608DRAFT_3623 [Variovorax sp. HW608]
MRRVLPFLLCILVFSNPAEASQPACSIESQTFDSKDVLCIIPAGEAMQRRFEFIARFSGSHDDTRVSIRPALGGQPLTCEEGSRNELFGEDGDVSLNCRFAVPAAQPTEARLKVTIRWSHAEYTDYALVGR